MKKILVFAVVMIFGCVTLAFAESWQIPWAGDRTKRNTEADRRDEGKVNPRTGEYYAPAGSGYVGRDGIYYAPAGPSGVINTRTGEFIPTN
jgi:hypothetical protein